MSFDPIPQLAGEFNFSPKKALGLLMWGIIAATLIYLAMMLATSIAVGTRHDAFEGEVWPPAAAISEVMGPAGLGLMVVAVSAGVLTGLNGFFTAASRVLFTLGRANLVSSRLGELHGKQRTPRNAILLVCGVPGDPVVWARGVDVGCRYVQCLYHGGVLLYLLLRMEDCAHWAGPRDAQAHCAEQVL